MRHVLYIQCLFCHSAGRLVLRYYYTVTKWSDCECIIYPAEWRHQQWTQIASILHIPDHIFIWPWMSMDSGYVGMNSLQDIYFNCVWNRFCWWMKITNKTSWGKGSVENSKCSFSMTKIPSISTRFDYLHQPPTTTEQFKRQNLKWTSFFFVKKWAPTVSLLDDSNPWQGVRYTDPGSYEGQPHHGVGDTKGEP